MNVDVQKNVESLVQFVVDLAFILSTPIGKRSELFAEPVKDLTQAKAAFMKLARRLDRSSPRRRAFSEEQEIEMLFVHILNLQGDRYRNDEEMIGVLGICHQTVGHFLAKQSQNYELAIRGRLGARKRYAPMRELETWTLSEYQRGNWKSANQAAHALKDAVVAQGRTLGATLAESNAQRTIAEWINKDKKRSSR